MLRESFKVHVLVFAAVVMVAGLPFFANYVFLLRANEVSPYSTIVKQQLERSAVYESAFNGNDLKYKVELIAARKPEIVVVGSSRSMNVRGLVFKRPFVNAGGVSSNMLESETFIREMLNVHRPQLVLYFVDYWWFNPRSDQTSNRYGIDETVISYAKLTSPFKWLRSGKISWDLYRDVLLNGRYENEYTSFEHLGLFSIRYSSGFRTDGSYFNVRDLQREQGVVGYFWKELEQIRHGQSERVNLGLGQFASEALVRRFLAILDTLKASGVKVIVVLPPVAPLYLKAIRAYGNTPYVTTLTERLRKDISPLYDFTDFAGGTPCEYLDGYHIGDTLSLRVLRAILERDPDSPLAPYIDRRKLDDYISRYAGRVVIDEPADKYKKREFDFLGLGCPKPAAEPTAARLSG